MQVFVASICHHGAQGGAVVVTENGVCFQCRKISIEEKYRHFVMSFDEMKQIEPCRSLFVFPAVKITMHNGVDYKFLIFSRKRFLRCCYDKTCIKSKKIQKNINNG